MKESLSQNTQAILLLTAPLTIGRSVRAEILTPTEYFRLRDHLRDIQKEPASLIEHESEELLDECVRAMHTPKITRDRLQSLLDRGFLLSQASGSWSQRGIWVVSRDDEMYPQKFRERLPEKIPPILYGCGDISLLNASALAVVGSRNVDEEILEYARRSGELATSAQRAIASGGAKGVDRAAMNGALEAGGQSIGVLANDLKRAVTNRTHRDAILNEQLVLVSPYDPSSRFTVWQAMNRNKFIYALADAALVVNADKGKGGTWAGAVEQLAKKVPRPTPVYIRSTGSPSTGLEALKQKGARPWANPKNANDLEKILDAISSKSPDSSLFDTESTVTDGETESGASKTQYKLQL